MRTSLLLEKHLKKQLLEFMEDREEPFSISLLVNCCLQPIPATMIRDMLCKLVDEGEVIRIDDERYMATRVLMKKWLRQKIKRNEEDVNFDELEVPRNLFKEISKLLRERPELGYIDESDFIRDAIRRSLYRR
ncbi:hypothetical protein CW706_03615 [Candidatus Bathyarchaeota archaeon]|nr:MAG: hypothetical protein CW706_03615 [Candidatus Bathyarchaeota archaeon]